MIIPSLYDAAPYPEGPRYFYRDWNLVRSTLTPLRYNATRLEGFGRPLHLLGPVPGPVRIYGYSCRSPHLEDHQLEDWLWAARRAIPAICFSTLVPSGQYAFTPAAALIEITRESLERELSRLSIASLKRNAS
jgi:hypothetical protein